MNGIFDIKSYNIFFFIYFNRLYNLKTIRFVDDNGNILLEYQLKQTVTKKICGEWYNVPPYYLKYIAKKQLHLTITTGSHHKGEVAGVPEYDTSFDHGKHGTCIIFMSVGGGDIYWTEGVYIFEKYMIDW